jgi:hypothetical protein
MSGTPVQGVEVCARSIGEPSKQAPNFCAVSVKADKRLGSVIAGGVAARESKKLGQDSRAFLPFPQPLPLGKGVAMMSRNLLLLQSIQGHLELLAQKHPKKAATPVARKAKQYVRSCLRQAHRPLAA